MNAKEWAMAENLARQIARKNLLRCPNCAYISDVFGKGPEEPGNKQTLSKLGDSENKLICPHCDLLVHLMVDDDERETYGFEARREEKK